jgi:hypothetical protein
MGSNFIPVSIGLKHAIANFLAPNLDREILQDAIDRSNILGGYYSNFVRWPPEGDLPSGCQWRRVNEGFQLKSEPTPLGSLQITNQCIVVCDLRNWTSADSSAWYVVSGTQDDVGKDVAPLVDDSDVNRIDDFGGVCRHLFATATPTAATRR